MGVLIGCVAILMCVPWYTLLERKVLGYGQLRKGPSKVGVLGLVQPIADALKLLSKGGWWRGSFALGVLMMVCPIGLFGCVLFSWGLYPCVGGGSYYYPLTLVVYLCFLSLSIFPVIMGGWGGSCKYGVLGGARAAAQSVSFEVVFLSVVFLPVVVYTTVSFGEWFGWGWFVSILGIGLMYIMMVCETNRAPLDFAEGESELVSGFNTEFSGLPFALFFLGEYGSMMFGGVLVSLVFVGVGWLSLVCVSLFFSLLFLLLRVAYPRYRYDLLMEWGWGVGVLVAMAVWFVMGFLVW